MKLSDVCRTWGDVRRLLEALEAKGDLGALRLRRELAGQVLRAFEGRGQASPEWLPPAAETGETLRRLEELGRAEGERRRLEQRVETIRAETSRLRRSRCERTVDAAVRRGVIARHAREATVRQLEGGDVNLRCALDPYFTPPMPSEEEYARQFEDRFGEKPVLLASPRTAEEAERRQLAATLGIREEEVI